MILMYHNVVPSTAPGGHRLQSITLQQRSFEKQMRWLKVFSDVVSLEDYLKAPGSSGKSRKKTTAITFDDGTWITYKTISPLCKRLNLPASIFVTTSQIDDGPLIWGAYLNALCYEAIYDEIRVDGALYSLSSTAQRHYARNQLLRAASGFANPAEAFMSIKKTYPLPSEIEMYYKGMTTEQLHHAANSKLMTIGAHSVNHPCLSRMSPSSQFDELIQSKRRLESITRAPVNYFAYPCGDYSAETIVEAKRAGYLAAFAVRPRCVCNPPGAFEIPRIGIFSASIAKFLLKLLLPWVRSHHA